MSELAHKARVYSR